MWTRFRSERASQQLRAFKATELASNLRAIIAAGNIDARCAIDSDTVNVFRKREAIVITSKASGLYLWRHQTNSGNSTLRGRVFGNDMTKENMMQVVTEWMGRYLTAHYAKATGATPLVESMPHFLFAETRRGK